MQLTEAYAKLLQINAPVFETRDAAALWQINPAHASTLLARLKHQNLLYALAHGKWTLSTLKNTMVLPEYLTAPEPSYISLQSALHFHGMIEQIPDVIYAVSLARTKRYKTPLGTFSIHHVQPTFFFGFESIDRENIKMATPEKALVDYFYFSSTKTRLFTQLPELILPRSFSLGECRQMAERIQAKSRKSSVLAKINDLK